MDKYGYKYNHFGKEAGNIYLNGLAAGTAIFGGVSYASLTVTETS